MGENERYHAAAEDAVGIEYYNGTVCRHAYRYSGLARVPTLFIPSVVYMTPDAMPST